MEINDLGEGDIMRMDTTLLSKIYAMPQHHSMKVRVKEVRVDTDGTKILVVETLQDV